MLYCHTPQPNFFGPCPADFWQIANLAYPDFLVAQNGEQWQLTTLLHASANVSLSWRRVTSAV